MDVMNETDFMNQQTQDKVSTEDVYKYIVDFEKEHLYPPTIREICEATGVGSTSTAYYKLRKLEHRRWISIDRNGRIKIQGFRVIEDGVPHEALEILRNTK